MGRKGFSVDDDMGNVGKRSDTLDSTEEEEG